MSRPRAIVLAAAAGAALISGCGIGQTGLASRVTDVGATLNGKAYNTEPGVTRWRFEHGPTATYGSTTPWRESLAVEETVGGLAHGSTHHFRLCAADERGYGVCGADQSFTTTDGEDSVVGAGVLVDAAEFSYEAAVDAHSGASGAAPRGTGRARPGASSPRGFDEGSVACLRVDADRATVGIDVTPPIAGMPHTGRLVYIKDNGPTGDYLAHYELDAPPATCPAATDDKFISQTPGQPPFAALVSGDFQVHDHPSGTSSRR